MAPAVGTSYLTRTQMTLPLVHYLNFKWNLRNSEGKPTGESTMETVIEYMFQLNLIHLHTHAAHTRTYCVFSSRLACTISCQCSCEQKVDGRDHKAHHSRDKAFLFFCKEVKLTASNAELENAGVRHGNVKRQVNGRDHQAHSVETRSSTGRGGRVPVPAPVPRLF